MIALNVKHSLAVKPETSCLLMLSRDETDNTECFILLTWLV